MGLRNPLPFGAALLRFPRVQVATEVAMAKPPRPPPSPLLEPLFPGGADRKPGLFFPPSDLGRGDEACACTSCVTLDKLVSLSERQDQRFGRAKSCGLDPSLCR